MTATFSKSDIQWVPLDQLQVHPRAQRQFNEAWGKQLAASFDPDALGVLLVVEDAKGGKYIVDGQHRAFAIRSALGATQKVPCYVHQVKDEAGAARIFLAGNRHKAVKTLDKFLVRVIAGDPVAVGVVEILNRYHLEPTRSRRDGSVQAVDACESIYKRPNGAEVLDRTLAVLSHAWGRNPDAYHAQLVRGVGIVLARYGATVDIDELARKLAKSSGPVTLIGQVRDLAAAAGLSAQGAAATRIVSEYNKGKRTGKLPEALAA